MSVEQAQEELSFLVTFQSSVESMMQHVDEWETYDAMPEGTSGRSEQIDLRKAWYGRDRKTIDTNLVRFKDLALRYRVALPEHLLFVNPTDGRQGYGEYRKSFPEVNKLFVLQPINMVRGALERQLLEEQNHTPTPRLTNAWRTFVSVLDVLDKRGYLKPVVFTALALILLCVLHFAGFDLKSALELLKAIK